MATRSSTAGGYTSGDPWGTADANSLPGGLIGYATVTSSQSGITTVADLTGLTLTLTPLASRIIKLEWFFDVQDDTAQGTTETFRMFVVKDGSNLAQHDYVSNPGAATNNFSVGGFAYDFAPTSASHTYKLQGARSGTASGSFTMLGSATRVAAFSISDVGPSF